MARAGNRAGSLMGYSLVSVSPGNKEHGSTVRGSAGNGTKADIDTGSFDRLTFTLAHWTIVSVAAGGS